MSCLASCCASLTCGICTSVASGITKRSARIAYCGLFGVSLIVSWILREVAAPLLKHFSWINTSDNLSKEWFQIQAVLRVSLGNFLFFGILALIMIGVKDQNDRRDSWHHGGWIAKMLIWALLIILMFFLPNVIISVYGVLSKFGAGLFLLVQVIILLDATHSWNDSWVAKDEQKWYLALLAVSVACYIAAFTISGLLFIWFNPSGHDCGLNVFFLVMTIILAFVFAVIALHPKVNGSLLPASVISVYCAYLFIPVSLVNHEITSAMVFTTSQKRYLLALLFLGCLQQYYLFYILHFVLDRQPPFLSPPSFHQSRFHTPNGDKKPLLEADELESGKGKNDAEARPVSYSYTFFHLIFALASMYSAMLLSGWTSSSENPDLIDVGWTSVWVRICTEWVTAGLYIWSLIAPLLFPDREFY
ncbi:UNVERIFIED_CONTAM: Serine incorporator 3 [Sesamum radiatum]|uniref:Serine incorporator 3 n=1 Tax=Sesamum radiatum TaxID=300843 RepID=A0AAW2UBC9_SESRA